MTARSLPARPRPRPGFVPVSAPVSSCSSSAVSAVRVGWDDLRSLDVAVCGRCAESMASPRAGEVDDWADAHRCDAELAALLALVTDRRAA
ncbi:hypothetical protein [Actinomadura macra]|uniref:hypothetical protein n=1 Tax=Actinomadura macra TaxID=46164 RepID=UPI000A9FAE27|nr:hypothetical protein [Actinomadura macra]